MPLWLLKMKILDLSVSARTYCVNLDNSPIRNVIGYLNYCVGRDLSIFKSTEKFLSALYLIALAGPNFHHIIKLKNLEKGV